MPVRKAVIPVAGFGTRVLPATKSLPKVMLPLVDRPAIQYLVEETVRAGVDDVVLVTSSGQDSIGDHFDRSAELEAFLEEKGKEDLLSEVRAISALARVHYVRQAEQLGLGHAILTARDHVGDEPFVAMLGDEIIWGTPLLEPMMAAHGDLGCSVIAVMEVDESDVSKYGIVDPGDRDGPLVRVRAFVEKPSPAEAPSRLAAIGRYVLVPDLFPVIEQTAPGAGGEIQLTDAIGALLHDQPVYAYVFTGTRFDIGKKVDFLRANLELALYRDDLGAQVRDMLREVGKKHDLF